MTQVPPQYPPPGFAPGMPPQAPMKPHRGTMILIFGILGLCCIVFPILAVVFAGTDLKEMDAGRMDPSGRSLTNTGRIIGWVMIALGVIGLIVNIAIRAAN